MGKLKNSIVYLAGPMEFCPDDGVKWRNYVTPILKEDYQVNIIDPCNKPTDRAQEGPETKEQINKLRQAKNYDAITEFYKEIRNVDLRFCDFASFAIVHLDFNIPMMGTIEELVTLNRSKKPIIVHAKQPKETLPGWLFGMLPHNYFFNSFTEVFNFLDKVDSGQYIDKRWLFLNI
jgi:hypothetical protein